MSGRAYSENDIHLALDGELPDDEGAGFAAWLEEHPDMKAQYVRYGEDRARLREAMESVGQETIPPRLMAALTARSEPADRSPWKFAAMAAALVAVGVLGGYLASTVVGGTQSVAAAPLTENAIAAHLVYSNEKRHVVEVGADQFDHLNTWLSNRVGLKLAAPDLTAQGFELVGGRLLPAGEGKAAQFMYQDASGGRISLYVTPATGRTQGGYGVAEQRGALALYWEDEGYGCVVTGALPKAKLTQIADAAYEQIEKVAAAQ